VSHPKASLMAEDNSAIQFCNYTHIIVMLKKFHKTSREQVNSNYTMALSNIENLKL